MTSRFSSTCLCLIPLFAANLPGRCSAVTLGREQQAVDNMGMSGERGQAIPVTDAEYALTADCSFKNEQGVPASCVIEAPEHELVREFIGAGSIVLELGARYGTTTCAIANAQGNSGKVIAVEPDSDVWVSLQGNLNEHKCAASIHTGVVGTVSHNRSYGSSYAVHYSLIRSDSKITFDKNAGRSWKLGAVPISFEDLQNAHGLQFNTLLVDCEGCLESFLIENPGALQNVSTILIEADSGIYGSDSDPDCAEAKSCVDYNRILERFQSEGFKIKKTFQEGQGERAVRAIPDCCPWIHHFALLRSESK